MKRDSISLLMVWGLQTNLIGSNGKKNLPAMQENWVRSLGQERSPEDGNSYPLQYSGLENSMDCTVYGVAESDTTEQLSLSLINYLPSGSVNVTFSNNFGEGKLI